jgi:hypothetical protein
MNTWIESVYANCSHTEAERGGGRLALEFNLARTPCRVDGDVQPPSVPSSPRYQPRIAIAL